MRVTGTMQGAMTMLLLGASISCVAAANADVNAKGRFAPSNQERQFEDEESNFRGLRKPIVRGDGGRKLKGDDRLESPRDYRRGFDLPPNQNVDLATINKLTSSVRESFGRYNVDRYDVGTTRKGKGGKGASKGGKDGKGKSGQLVTPQIFFSRGTPAPVPKPVLQPVRSPVTAPVIPQIPVLAPVSGPVPFPPVLAPGPLPAPPVIALVPAPVPFPPVLAPVVSSTQAPVPVPAIAPIPFPPVLAPSVVQTPAPVPAPVTAPIAAPVAASVPAPVTAPTTSPVTAPVTAAPTLALNAPTTTSPLGTPTTDPTTSPTVAPSSNTISTSVPTTAFPVVAGPNAETTTTPTTATPSSTASVTSSPASSAGAVDCSKYQATISLNDKLSFSYVATPGNTATGQPGVVSAEVVFLGVGYVALGFSPDGSMAPNSQAVIGLGALDVSKYNLLSKSDSGVVKSPQQTLEATDFVQNATHTVMRFTKLLVEDGEVAIPLGSVMNVIWAYGSTNALTYHASRGSTPVSFEACEANTSETLPPTTMLPLADSATNAPVTLSPMEASVASASPASSTAAPTLATSAAGPAGASPVDGASPISETPVPTAAIVVTTAPSTTEPTLVSAASAAAPGASPVETGPASPVTETLAPAEAPTVALAAAATPLNSFPTVGSAVPSTLSPAPSMVSMTPEPLVPETPAPVIPDTVTGAPVTSTVDCIPSNVVIKDGLSFSYVAVNRNMATGEPGTLAVEMVYSGVGYVALGFSEDGEMDPTSQAIIGLSPDSVVKYNLLSKSESGVQQSSQQTLTDTFFDQSGEQTVMRFTKLLVEENEVQIRASEPTYVIWAVGSSNQLGYHSSRGSIPMTFEFCVQSTGMESDENIQGAPLLPADLMESADVPLDPYSDHPPDQVDGVDGARLGLLLDGADVPMDPEYPSGQVDGFQ